MEYMNLLHCPKQTLPFYQVTRLAPEINGSQAHVHPPFFKFPPKEDNQIFLHRTKVCVCQVASMEHNKSLFDY